ncbi:hypothetical protein CDAR_238971 [Caerostris darwini]|uniref:DNA-directed RNA polymerase n=1 Tax=Caerostris darwini TaxID=1538125 RepID=A0AAV4PS64_9ARAC|nr:hypothetical protein CDAR_238971 [Caerostris darwini]
MKLVSGTVLLSGMTPRKSRMKRGVYVTAQIGRLRIHDWITQPSNFPQRRFTKGDTHPVSHMEGGGDVLPLRFEGVGKRKLALVRTRSPSVSVFDGSCNGHQNQGYEGILMRLHDLFNCYHGC